MSPGVTFHSLFLADARYSASQAATRKGQDPGCRTGDLEKATESGRAAERELCLLRAITCWPDAQGRQGGPAALCRECLAPESHLEHPEPSPGCFILNSRAQTKLRLNPTGVSHFRKLPNVPAATFFS